MELNNLISFALEIQGRVNFYWNLYIVGITGLLGWLVSGEKKFSREVKLLISVGFFIFVIINACSLIRSYDLLSAIVAEVQSQVQSLSKIGKDPFQTEGIEVFIKSFERFLSNRTYLWTVTAVHLVLDLGILYILWSNKFKTSQNKRNSQDL